MLLKQGMRSGNEKMRNGNKTEVSDRLPTMAYTWRLCLIQRGTFLRLLIFERVGISLIEVQERIGKSVILVDKKAKKG